MIARAGIALVLVFFSSAAWAQTSSVSLQPQASSDGSMPPFAERPLVIVDGDYPFASLLANEEGRTSLNLLVDNAGRVTFAQRLGTSGSDHLDQAAIQIARTRWTFKPATDKGQPTTGSVRIDVTWKLPLVPAEEYKPDIPDLPAGSNPLSFKRPEPITAHTIGPYDYPRNSVIRGEQGIVIAKYLIAEDGSVGDFRLLSSSGFSRLDASAKDVVTKRWKFRPATVDGKPVKVWQDMSIVFELRDGPNSPAQDPRRFCTGQPQIGASMRMSPTRGSDGIEVGQWIHVTADGSVDDVIVDTEKGWMRFSKALIETLSQTVHNQPVARGRRPESCWYDGGVVVPATQPSH
jgi:TonB family protein